MRPKTISRLPDPDPAPPTPTPDPGPPVPARILCHLRLPPTPVSPTRSHPRPSHPDTHQGKSRRRIPPRLTTYGWHGRTRRPRE